MNDVIPYPGTIYPAESYPSGNSYGEHYRQDGIESSRWARVVGLDTTSLLVDGMEVWPRTVEHRLTIRRGRSSHTGDMDSQTISGSFIGAHDPALVGGDVMAVKLDVAAVYRHTGIQLPIDAQVRADGAHLDELTTDPRRERTVTGFHATGNLSRAGRTVIASPPWPQETVAQRFVRIMQSMQTAGASITWDRADAHAEPVLSLDVDTRTGLEVLQELAGDSGGTVYEGRLGRLGWIGLSNSKAGAAAATIPAKYCRPMGEWVNTTDGMVNYLAIKRTRKWITSRTVQNDDGTTSTELEEHEKEERIGSSADQEMIGRHGLYAATHDAGTIATSLATINIARQLQKRSGRPLWTPPAMQIDLLRIIEDGQTATLLQLLRLEVGTFISITSLPAWLPVAPSTRGDYWVEGITETITHEEWTITLDLSRFERHMDYTY